MIIAAVADAVILAMRWREKVNAFVLIFIILSAVVFAVGRVVLRNTDGIISCRAVFIVLPL